MERQRKNLTEFMWKNGVIIEHDISIELEGENKLKITTSVRKDEIITIGKKEVITSW